MRLIGQSKPAESNHSQEELPMLIQLTHPQEL